jgi:hypothetical protein
VRELPKFFAACRITIPGKPDVTYTFSEEVPKEIMDAYEQVVGNGLARVTVSADMSLKDYGNGASSMCSVTLTCNQDEQTIQRAVGLAAGLANYYAKQNRAAAENELKASVQSNPGGPRFG